MRNSLLLLIWSKLLKKIRGAAVRGSTVHATSKVESGSTFYDSQIGKYSFCGYDCEISHAQIGAFCSIANEVLIGGGLHPIDWASTSPVFYDNRDSISKKFSKHARPVQKTVVIGNDVWIGSRAIIMQGVTIGTGAVIGAGSVVTRDVPPYAVVAGVPARLIRMRFDDSLISRLLSSEWWQLSDEILATAAIEIRKPSEFLRVIKK